MSEQVLGEQWSDGQGSGDQSPNTADLSHQNEVDLVRLLRQGDEMAFNTLLDRYHVSMVRLARSYVSNEAAAEDVVGDTWLAVVRGLERFEGRSTVKTWLFRILLNRARSNGAREAKSVPFSSLDHEAGPTIESDRFVDASDRWVGYWSAPPCVWPLGPESSVDRGEMRRSIGRALDRLPPTQQTVVTLRDVHGLSASEVCEILDVSEANQRVLLHRGRAKLRLVLESMFDDGLS